MGYTPPPHVDTIPDYVCGRLVYLDTEAPGALKWTVYNGAQHIRFISREAAVTWCIQQSEAIDEQSADELYQLYYRQNIICNRIERLMQTVNPDIMMQLQAILEDAQRILVKIDNITSQIKHDKDQH